MIMQEAVKSESMPVHTVIGLKSGDNIAYIGLAEEWDW